ncbi:MAG TPA: hypothetical protein VK416_14185 [Thermoanaerobaculia bacterium]|nr:hypothetical protein [Thermoanaerobaculia bacterium]
MKLSPDQAHYVLNELMSQGRIHVAHIQKVLKNRDQEIRSLRERLVALERLSLAAPARARRRRGRPGRVAVRKARVRRKIQMSPRVRALRQQQGKYMGYVRRLKTAEKARVRSVREKQGMEAAIRLAKSLGAKT